MYKILLLLVFFVPVGAFAEIASTNYVSNTTVTKTGNNVQTMSGNYDVQGTITVKTPTLPTAE